MWPKYALLVHGPQPLLRLVFAARVMLAAEHPGAFAVLERAGVANELLQKWLQRLLLPVLRAECASCTVALSLLFGPGVLAAAAVAAVGLLRGGIAKAAAGGEEAGWALADWMRAAHCYDVTDSEFIAQTLQIEGRHRDTVLPLLLSPVGGT